VTLDEAMSLKYADMSLLASPVVTVVARAVFWICTEAVSEPLTGSGVAQIFYGGWCPHLVFGGDQE